jgi:hypothetical protein
MSAASSLWCPIIVWSVVSNSILFNETDEGHPLNASRFVLHYWTWGKHIPCNRHIQRIVRRNGRAKNRWQKTRKFEILIFSLKVTMEAHGSYTYIRKLFSQHEVVGHHHVEQRLEPSLAVGVHAVSIDSFLTKWGVLTKATTKPIRHPMRIVLHRHSHSI